MANNSTNEAYVLSQILKGKTPEQEKVIRYFYQVKKGCFGKLMTDAEYDKMVTDYLTKNSYFKKQAINTIGLDESEISLIEPVCLCGYLFLDNSKNLARRGVDRLWRSSAYQVTWLFFSDKQVYLCQYTINFDENGKKQVSEEYFYKDITNFSSFTETVEKEHWEMEGCISKKPVLKRDSVEKVGLKIVVPGDSLLCVATVNDDKFETSLKGMKNLLREKKNS